MAEKDVGDFMAEDGRETAFIFAIGEKAQVHEDFPAAICDML